MRRLVATMALCASACVVDWDPPAGSCDVCSDTIVISDVSGCSKEDRGWHWQSGKCYRVYACACDDCIGAATQDACEEAHRACALEACGGPYQPVAQAVILEPAASTVQHGPRTFGGYAIDPARDDLVPDDLLFWRFSTTDTTQQGSVVDFDVPAAGELVVTLRVLDGDDTLIVDTSRTFTVVQ